MSALKKFIEVLRRTEFMTEEGLAAYQRKPLEKILRHARATVPFYRDRLAVLFRRNGSIDWDRWEEIPLLTKADIRDHGDDLLSRHIPAYLGAVKETQTAGTTGPPATVKVSSLAILAVGAITARFHDWHRIDRDLKLASIRLVPEDKAAYPLGHHKPVWADYADYLDCHGPFALLDINTPVHLQAEWLARERPDYLHTLAGNAGALAVFVQNNPNIGPIFPLKRVLTFAETLSDITRTRCREAFDAEIADCYSSHECGYFALQCPQTEQYHIQSEVGFVEVLDDFEKPCATGHLGRVITTPLYNYAMPLIRYEVKDFAVRGEPCSCGRGLPVLNRIVGRFRHLFRFPDGSRLQPNFSHGTFLDILGPRQWQVAQTRPLEIEVRYVAGDRNEPVDFDAMTAHIRRVLRPDVAVIYRPVQQISLTPGGKHEDYVCELNDGEEGLARSLEPMN